MNHRARCMLSISFCFIPALTWCLPLSEYHARSDDTLDLFVAGSSAQDRSLQQLFRLICDANSLDVYRANGGDVRLMFCRAKAGAGAVAGQKIALHKSSLNGSGGGVGPLIEKTPVQFANVADLRAHFNERCPAGEARKFAAEGSLTAYTEYQCVNPNPLLEVPDAGITDVEPRLFLSAYHLTPDALDALSVHSANAFIFGIPVSLGLRDALQAAKFPAANPCNPGNSHYSDIISADRNTQVKRGETEACMPGLSRAQLSGIFAGTIEDWRQIVTARGAPLAARGVRTGAIESPVGVHPPSDDKVYICRRIDTSGTQAAYEMFFLNERCAQGVSRFVETGANVFVGSTTSDVKTCLAELDRRNVWAVGIMSTENVETPKDRWRFVKMDAVAPTLLNTFNGKWPFFVEQSYQWRGEHSDRPLQGSKLALMAQIGMELGDPFVIRELDKEFRHSWGSAGVMALSYSGRRPPLPRPGTPVDEAAVIDNPVLAVHHESNNCGGVLAAFPTPLP